MSFVSTWSRMKMCWQAWDIEAYHMACQLISAFYAADIQHETDSEDAQELARLLGAVNKFYEVTDGVEPPGALIAAESWPGLVA